MDKSAIAVFPSIDGSFKVLLTNKDGCQYGNKCFKNYQEVKKYIEAKDKKEGDGNV